VTAARPATGCWRRCAATGSNGSKSAATWTPPTAGHARWAVELVTQAARGLRGAGEAGWAARLDVHIGDLRAAHSWLTGHDTELSLRMRAELHWYALLLLT